MVNMFNLPKIGIKKLVPKLTKERENEKEAIIYEKVTWLETLVIVRKDSFVMGMYVAKLLALI